MVSADAPTRRRLTGTRFGRYLVGTALGSGAAATVYLARLEGPHGFERVLALKIIHEHLVDQQEFVDLFLDEAKLAVRLSHPNIVHVYELGREGSQLFMALEYLHGQTLATICQRLLESRARIPCDVVAWIGARAAEGLHHAHELTDDKGVPLGLVHRDVSPQNLFITYDGQVKVIDFGIARAEGRLAQTAQGKIRGKFRYMAPEQLLGSEFDRRADLFALGATLYELAVNAPLFDGKDLTDILSQVVEAEIPDPRSRRPEIPEDLVLALRKALSPEPETRYAQAADLARDLDRIVSASGATDQKARLAQQMSVLFPKEMEQRARALTELRTMPIPLLESAFPTAAPGDDLDPSVPVTQMVRKPRRWWVLGGALAVIATGVAALWYGLTPSRTPSIVAPTLSASVMLDIRVQPPADAAVRVKGELIEQRPARAHVPRSNDPIDVEVLATGFDRALISVIPDRDQFIVVPLVRVVPSAPSATAEPPPSQKPPTPSTTSGSKVPPTSTPAPQPTTNTGIEKNYPL